MADLSPGSAISLFAGFLLGGLKVLAEVLKWRNSRRLKEAERTIPASAPAPPAKDHAPPLEHSLAVQLEAEHIKLLRAQFQIEELEQALRRVRAEHEQTVRRMRQALDEAAQDQSRLAAAVSVERAANLQLRKEMDELRRTGGENERTDDRATASRAGRGVHGVDRGGDRLRATRRPGRGEGD